jgi:hypothetical protein
VEGLVRHRRDSPRKSAITVMTWSKNGKLLAFASEAGDCGVVDIAA